KFAVATYGTEGDARPMAALCRALMDAGHEARLLADHATLGAAIALGVPSIPLAGDIKGMLQREHAISSVVAEKRGFSSMASALAHIANTHAQAWLRDIVRAGEDCDAIVVSGLAAFVGLSAAEHLGVKAIGAGLIPITPTKAFASPFLPSKWIPKCFNFASQSLVNQMLWRAFRKKTNAARASVCGLPPRRDLWTRHPMLYGISPSLIARPDDWPDNARICGQWVPPSASWVAPCALTDFLAAGEAPVYIGFGSMAGFEQGKLVGEMIAAVAGRRALFYPGWSGADVCTLPANFHVIGDTPHDWLFPQTSLVIHHGGSGTSHSAARAGVPSVVVPFAGDQFFWADRLRHAGVAGAPLNGRKLHASVLARSIECAEGAEAISRAHALAERMKSENGLRDAVAAIEAMMSGSSR
ncbi:MAG TPA: glycosyltransferase, partial [Paraburkholderia sp.]|nr:glycosyltransferase [Paraburkholderia sp.]